MHRILLGIVVAGLALAPPATAAPVPDVEHCVILDEPLDHPTPFACVSTAGLKCLAQNGVECNLVIVCTLDLPPSYCGFLGTVCAGFDGNDADACLNGLDEP